MVDIDLYIVLKVIIASTEILFSIRVCAVTDVSLDLSSYPSSNRLYWNRGEGHSFVSSNFFVFFRVFPCFFVIFLGDAFCWRTNRGLRNSIPSLSIFFVLCAASLALPLALPLAANVCDHFFLQQHSPPPHATLDGSLTVGAQTF